MKSITLLVLLFLFSFAPISRAEVAKDKRQEIEKMLRLTGMQKMMDQMMDQMIDSMKGKMTEVPEVFWDKFKKKMKLSDLVEKIIPIYDKYYTLEDLKAVNAFYESPAGQKVLASLPKVMAEIMPISEKWGEEIGKQAAAEAREELAKEKF